MHPTASSKKLFIQSLTIAAFPQPRLVFWLFVASLAAAFPCLAHADIVKTISVTPEIAVQAVATWDANCTTLFAVGSYTVVTAPQHGSLSFGDVSGVVTGCPPSSPPLTAAAAFYTWTDTNPGDTQDYFVLDYIVNGTVAGVAYITVINTGTQPGKSLGRPQTPCGCGGSSNNAGGSGGSSANGSSDSSSSSNVGSSNSGSSNWNASGSPQAVSYSTDGSSGNIYYETTDYTTAGQNPLILTRYYNGRGNMAVIPLTGLATAVPLASGFNANWRTNYDRHLEVDSATSVVAERTDGRRLTFTLIGSVWTPDSDVDITLTHSGGTWVLTDSSDTVETYPEAVSDPTTPSAPPHTQPTSIASRNGYTQTLTYSDSLLASVTDSYGRSLSFSYAGKLLQSVTTPDGTTINYGYTGQALTSVTYPTATPSTLTYVYANPSFPYALTDVIDENGNEYASWTYDTYGRTLTTSQGDGQNLTSIVYNTDGSRVVTNALGVADTYSFTTLQGIAKLTGISRAATTTTAAATMAFTYDANGYLASQTDWNGNLTNYINNSLGLPLWIFEAANTPVVRTTRIIYDATFVHLPAHIAAAGLVSSITYDANGNLAGIQTVDDSGTYLPYRTQDQERSWTYTWSNFLLASVTGPRTDVSAVTQFTYDASGALTSIDNALGQKTRIAAHTRGGLPQTIIDPNGVTTTLTYDGRQRLLSSTLSTGTGPLVTTSTYDAAGNLIGTTLPDGSAITRTYDTAHRLTKITDLLHQSVNYVLDALGDPTQWNLAASGIVQRQHSDAFDALGRTLQDVGGMGQTTTYAYDANGNPLTLTDPLSHVTAQTFDALNRVINVTDANGGTTAITYDLRDRPLTVTDANGNVTKYIYDGFGDLIEQISPDSGAAIYVYDANGNLTTKIDAAANVTNRTFDALDRPLTTTYPADAAENVAFTYDQTGHGFGIGRLTSMTDQMGSLSRSYDERGNLLTEVRRGGSITAKTAYTYDPASRLASITYPSGTVVKYSRDAMGQVTNIATSTATVASGITHLPFGPVNGFTFGNGIADTRSFDLDYRMTGLTDKASDAPATQSLTYAYDLANDVSAITDHQRPYLSQTLGYDVLNRLTSAAAADYGSFAWTYDNVGNRLSESRGTGSLLTSYGYAPSSNRLASLSVGGTPTQSYSYSPTGNLLSVAAGGVPIAGTSYNNANRIQAATGYGVTLAEYGYDGSGQRLAKLVAGTTPTGTLFQYGRDGSLLEEADLTGAAKADYIYLDGMPIGDVAPVSSSLYYLHTDHLGTPQGATDSAQTLVWGATYYPFGGTSYLAGTITQNLRLPGQYFDLETQSYHNGWRDYAPTFGRYVETDPIGLDGGVNTYAYANGNPGSLVDPTGEDFTISKYEGAGGFNHIGIGVNSDSALDTSGFYSTNSNDLGLLIGFSLQGREGSDSFEPLLDSITFASSPAVDQAIQSFIDQRRQNPGQYRLYGRNCATTVADALRSAGITVPHTILPNNLFDYLSNNQALIQLELTPNILQYEDQRYFHKLLGW